jgi:TMEM192 family
MTTFDRILFGFIPSMIHQYYGQNFAEHCIEGILSPVMYVTLFTGVENLIFFGLHLAYIIRVLRFNKSNELPDALQGTLYVGSVGLTQRNADIAELLEKQVSLFRFCAI